MVRDCGCPGLPDEGQAAPVDVVRVWAEGTHFGYIFVDDFTITYKDTGKTPDEFAEGIRRYNENPDETGAIGKLVGLRGTTAWVAELNEHGNAFVEWVEGTRNIVIAGGESQLPLGVLLEIAEGLSTN